MIPIPLILQMGFISAAVQYMLNEYQKDEPEVKVSLQGTDEMTNVISEDSTEQESQVLEERQKLLGRTCIENRRRIEELVGEHRAQNNILIDSIANNGRRTESMIANTVERMDKLTEKSNIHHEALVSNTKSAIDHSKLTYGKGAGITDGIRRQLTILEKAVQNTELSNKA